MLIVLHCVSFILIKASLLQGVEKALNKTRFDMILICHYDPSPCYYKVTTCLDIIIFFKKKLANVSYIVLVF